VATDAIGADGAFTPFAGKLRTDMLLVDSEVMPVLLRECTEQTVRVQLDENKTVANGPFQSEYLPAETILAASLSLREHGRSDAAGNDAVALQLLLEGALLQVGGDETLGKGLVWTRLLDQVQPLADPGQPGEGRAANGQPS
jgi:CRISPR-associated protein Cmr4